MTRFQAILELARREVGAMEQEELLEYVVDCSVTNIQGMTTEDLKSAFLDDYNEEITIED